MDTILAHLNDICYNCIIILRANGATESYTNQSGARIPKTGMLRIRAVEQLRAIFTLLSKRGPIRESSLLGPILRKKVIESMLYMMRTY